MTRTERSMDPLLEGLMVHVVNEELTQRVLCKHWLILVQILVPISHHAVQVPGKLVSESGRLAERGRISQGMSGDRRVGIVHPLSYSWTLACRTP